jgi:hypothetical protein
MSVARGRSPDEKECACIRSESTRNEDGLFELALAYFSQNAVLFSGPVADRVPWTGEEASDRRERLDRLN